MKEFLMFFFLIVVFIFVTYDGIMENKFGKACYMCKFRKKEVDEFKRRGLCISCDKKYHWREHFCPVCKKETTYHRGYNIQDIEKCLECNSLFSVI